MVPTNSEAGEPGAFLALVVVLISLLTLAVVALGTLGSFAQVAAASRSTPPGVNPSKLLEWIDKTGRPTVIRRNVARAFGLADHDIPVKERGFKVSEEKFTHVCSLGSGVGYEGLVFLASVDENDGRARVWRMDQDGTLIATATFDGEVAETVPNSRFAPEFAAELNYFLRKAHFATSRTDTAPPLPKTHGEVAAQAPGSLRSSRAEPLRQELMLIASNPLVLPAIVGILAAGALTSRKRR